MRKGGVRFEHTSQDPYPLPRREVMRDPSRPRDSSAVSATSGPPPDKIDLDMDRDQIIEEKAFMWACGRNTDGELGLGYISSEPGEISIPRNIEQLRDFPVKQFIASGNHVCLMTPSGQVNVAGSTLNGKLGLEGI